MLSSNNFSVDSRASNEEIVVQFHCWIGDECPNRRLQSAALPKKRVPNHGIQRFSWEWPVGRLEAVIVPPRQTFQGQGRRCEGENGEDQECGLNPVCLRGDLHLESLHVQRRHDHGAG